MQTDRKMATCCCSTNKRFALLLLLMLHSASGFKLSTKGSQLKMSHSVVRKRPLVGPRMSTSLGSSSAAAIPQIPLVDATATKIRRPFVFRGIREDLARRLPHYLSDWKDGFKKKTFAAVLFMYFACLAPTVAFGGLTNFITEGNMGVIEFIISTGVGGMFYSIFSGQPMTFLGPTGLTLAFTGALYKFTSTAGLPFLPLYSWTGIWTSFFLFLCSIFNVSTLIKLCTRFTDDVFNALLAVNFLYEAIKSIGNYFVKANADLVAAFAALNMAVVTWMSTKFVVRFKQKRMFTSSIRKFVADFGPSLVIVAMSAIAAHPAISNLGIEYLAVPKTFTLSNNRPWIPDLLSVPVNLRWAAMIPALLLTVLFYFDQNISVRAVNACDMKKGESYHLDMLVLSVIMFSLSSLGLPWICAATVQSLNHIRAMADVEVTVGDIEKIGNIIETRVSGLAIHAAIFGSLLLLPLLAHIPMPVISGIFLYLGRRLMKGNLFLDRITQIPMEKSLLPDNNCYNRLPKNTIYKYISIQSAMLALIWTLKQNPKLAMFFPACIIFLMASRHFILPRLFSETELKTLDPKMKGK